MKRGLVFTSLILLVLLTSFVLSANETDDNATVSVSGNDAKTDKAYTCLKDKVATCSSSLEENIFTSLAIGECTDKISSDSKFKTDTKLTALGILALKKAGNSYSDSLSWLKSQNATPSDVVWYLQVESSEATTCAISYSGGSYNVAIDVDKKVKNNAGACLAISENSYWLRVAESCYNTEFKISCDKSFQTNFLFKKQTSTTIYVSDKTSSASAEGTTTEKVNSLCLKQASSCNYEATLWGALVLEYLGEDTTPYRPYLVTNAEGNEKYLPEAFLYYLTDSGDYRSSILLKQKSSDYWDESGNKFYDTALALYPFQSETPVEKTNSIDWLLSVQDNDGCWRGNIRDTAFVLYSIFSRDTDGSSTNENLDCEDKGNYCMSKASCTGSVIPDYDCPGVLKCCTTPKKMDSCEELNGEICSSGETCQGGGFQEASDSERCCVQGTCSSAPADEETACEKQSYTCRAFSSGCSSNEQETTSYSCNYSDVCCMPKTSSGLGWWWIVILLILLILVALAIIFREKLKIFWFRIKTGSKKGGPSPNSANRPRPGFPPRPPMNPIGFPQRKIIPSQQPAQPMRNPVVARPVQPKSKSEIDDVLKKLREMGGKK